MKSIEEQKAERLYEMLQSGELFEMAIVQGVPGHAAQWFFDSLKRLLADYE